MENDESTSKIPYKDTPEVVPSGQRMPVNDPDANTAASKRSRGARQTSRGYGNQRQGDTAPYEEVARGRRPDDEEVADARERAAREEAESAAFDRDADGDTRAPTDLARQQD